MCCLCLTTGTANLFSITNVFQLRGSPGGLQITDGHGGKFFLFVCFYKTSLLRLCDTCSFVFVCVAIAYADLPKRPLNSE